MDTRRTGQAQHTVTLGDIGLGFQIGSRSTRGIGTAVLRPGDQLGEALKRWRDILRNSRSRARDSPVCESVNQTRALLDLSKGDWTQVAFEVDEVVGMSDRAQRKPGRRSKGVALAVTAEKATSEIRAEVSPLAVNGDSRPCRKLVFHRFLWHD